MSSAMHLAITLESDLYVICVMYLPTESRFQHVEHLLAGDEAIAVKIVDVEAVLKLREKGYIGRNSKRVNRQISVPRRVPPTTCTRSVSVPLRKTLSPRIHSSRFT